MCSSHKQRRISYSSFGAELFAASAAGDRGYDVKMSTCSIFPGLPLKHELLVDSKDWFEKLTSLHQGYDYLPIVTDSRMRDSFESKELNSIRWVPGVQNVADVLTKWNTSIPTLLNNMLAEVIWSVDIGDSAVLDSDTWN